MYPRLGDALKARFAGWTASFLTGDLRLARLIGLKPSRRTPLWNGAIECRLFRFDIVAGRPGRASRSARRTQKEPRRSGVPGDATAGQGLIVSPFAWISTRRCGCRQAIFSFRFFCSHTTPGTSCFSPRPSASILSFGTPLLTR